MERQDKILQEKFESLDDLPLDFKPNLESKWELLSAGLHTKKSDNRPKLFLYISGIAALFLAIFFMFRPEPISPKMDSALTLKEPVKKEFPLIEENKSAITIAPVSYKRRLTKKKEILEQISPTIDSIVAKEEPILLEVVEPIKEAPRYVEIDFTNEVYLARFPAANTEKKLVQFRFFKPELGSQSLGSSEASPLQFKANF